MAFSKNLFLVLFAIATVTSYQLNAMLSECASIEPSALFEYATDRDKVVAMLEAMNAMEEEVMTAMFEKPVASDLQIYQLLSAVTKDNPDLYLPDEVTRIIVINAYTVTEKIRATFYPRYGLCVSFPYNNFLSFIEDKLNHSTNRAIIVDILKTCLSCSSKSLSEIKGSERDSVLHYIKDCIWPIQRPECAKIICLVAGDNAWNLIKTKDESDCTVLHYASKVPVDRDVMKKPLSPIASPEEACKFIQELLSAAPSPKKAWRFINEQNDKGETALSLAEKQQNKEIIEILESYRPKEQ